MARNELLHHLAVNFDLEARHLLLDRFRKHELTHPVDPFLSAGNCEVVLLPLFAGLLGVRVRHQLEMVHAIGIFLPTPVLEVLDAVAKLGVASARAGDAVIINLDNGENIAGARSLVNS